MACSAKSSTPFPTPIPYPSTPWWPAATRRPAATDSLKGPALVIESSGGRVTRYAHNMSKALQLPSQAVALLTVLMLRGPQTAGELRINCERLHKFADISAVEGFLQELAERPEGAMVVELPRQPGSRENRWAHLLSGAPATDERAAAVSSVAEHGANVTVSEIAALKVNVARLEAEVDALKKTGGQTLCRTRGVGLTGANQPIRSDQGSQFSSHDWHAFLKSHNLVASMNQRDNCHDNGEAESTLQLLNRERIRRIIHIDQEEDRRDVFDYIDIFYNPKRWHRYVNRFFPIAFEEQHFNRTGSTR